MILVTYQNTCGPKTTQQRPGQRLGFGDKPSQRLGFGDEPGQRLGFPATTWSPTRFQISSN